MEQEIFNKNNSSWNPIWENVFVNNEWGKYPSESLIQFIAHNFYKKNRSEVKLLEVGCGTGANVWYITREGFDGNGIDGSETAIKRGIARFVVEGSGISIISSLSSS